MYDKVVSEDKRNKGLRNRRCIQCDSRYTALARKKGLRTNGEPYTLSPIWYKVPNQQQPEEEDKEKEDQQQQQQNSQQQLYICYACFQKNWCKSHLEYHRRYYNLVRKIKKIRRDKREKKKERFAKLP